ncbi:MULTISPECIES: alpha/beta hydrolase [Pseudomonas]|uniref:alpha/beta hydrolase n=1 Tax=Pseudomonas TaxID=286 RepID=UPI000C0C84E9|nr:alpha/beta hydrolase [Pseudomonadaceae bacterium]HCP55517.1 alpha/beta hydrolase [Pseudomonas sp.]
MNAYAEFSAPAVTQPTLRRCLRFALKVCFRSVMRPPVPIAIQRCTINLLTAVNLAKLDGTRTLRNIAGRPCEWYRPSVPNGSVMLYLHGGAYLVGSPRSHRSICTTLARFGQIEVCALDYRMAPEHPFPAARDDALAAYQALLAQGYGPEQIVVAGDSAGGNLSLVLALRLRELGLQQPAALVCFSPLTDYTGLQHHTPEGGDPMLHPAWLQQSAQLYCPMEVALDSPELSPVYADLQGLAPMLIQVGEDEALLNDSVRLAEQATRAGVKVELERYPGLWHVFQVYAGVLEVSDFALERVTAFLKSRGC